MTEHNLRVSARTLRASAGDDGPPWTFGGVSVAAGDVLHMDDGTRVLFTESELRKAAETQIEEPLTVDHPATPDGTPQYPPPTDETVGRVAQAGWVDDVEGVGYEATTHDEEIARAVQAGSFDVSVHPTFSLGEYDEEVEAYIAEDINFRDLSVVSKGDSPNNTAEYGPNTALASWTAEADIGAELEASSSDELEDSDDKQSLIQKTVTATLKGLGFNSDETPSEVAADASGGEEDDETTAAESAEESGTTMTDGTPEDDEEEQNEEEEEQEESRTIADMTVDELGSALKEQGFVTEDNATEFVEQATAQATKADKVDEIIAESDDYDEDDRDDLMASADSLVDKEHNRVTGTTGASLPGSAGARGSITAGAKTDDDISDYGTGEVSE